MRKFVWTILILGLLGAVSLEVAQLARIKLPVAKLVPALAGCPQTCCASPACCTTDCCSYIHCPCPHPNPNGPSSCCGKH